MLGDGWRSPRAPTSRLPLTSDQWVGGLRDVDYSERAPGPDAAANFRFVTPDYWKALGLPPPQGRHLDSTRGGGIPGGKLRG
jgi:hypothetical protein